MSTSFLPRRSQSAVQTRTGSLVATRVTLVILQLFVGIGGIFGGVEMIRDPLNLARHDTELIAGSPFDTVHLCPAAPGSLPGVTPLRVGGWSRGPEARRP